MTRKNSCILAICLILLAVVAISVSGCYYEDWTAEPTPNDTGETSTTATEDTTPVRVQGAITSREDALLEVYKYLLDKAESDEAKLYLADFYTACNKWIVNEELHSDGTSIWNVAVDMAEEENWHERSYWQQANWFILQDGTVLPSHKFDANALRIEADLQRLNAGKPLETESTAGETETGEGTETESEVETEDNSEGE